MGTTPVFGFPYPDPSDLVANYPALGQQLAEDVEAEFLLRGKILQIVTATDSTSRSTTSASLADASLSVTITPQTNTSKIWVIVTGRGNISTANGQADLAITNSSNVTILGGGSGAFSSGAGGMNFSYVMMGFDSPATISATTYKLRFSRQTAGTFTIDNSAQTGQIYAIEVAA